MYVESVEVTGTDPAGSGRGGERMRTTIAEKEYHLQNRNARIEKVGQDHYVVLDDVGYGVHRCWVCDTEAEELISLGLRDARLDPPTQPTEDE